MLRLYSPSKDSSALLQGVTGERIVVDYRRRLAYAKRVIPRWEHSSWKLIHDGIRGNFEAAFEIPTLTINGLSLVGVPDLVFREKKTGRILIVELKVSTAELPSDGWPNLRAQLWAYSRIERWAYQAPEVLLAGEVWQHEYTDPVRRATYFWRASNERLNHECKELFQVYGGVVAE